MKQCVEQDFISPHYDFINRYYNKCCKEREDIIRKRIAESGLSHLTDEELAEVLYAEVIDDPRSKWYRWTRLMMNGREEPLFSFGPFDLNYNTNEQDIQIIVSFNYF